MAQSILTTTHGGSVTPMSQVELIFEAQHLPNLDTGSKSDPQVYVMTKDVRTGEWTEVGKTEMIKDTLSPKWAKSVPMGMCSFYDFFDVDKEYGRLSGNHPVFNKPIFLEQDEIGTVETTLGDIVASKGGQHISRISHHKRKNNGVLIVTANEVSDSRYEVNFNLSASHLDKKDFFGKSDPYVEIHACNKNGVWTLVHRTEYIIQTLNPTWLPFTLPLYKLSPSGNTSQQLRIEVYDWDKNAKPDFIGSFVASIDEMIAKPDCYQNSGVLHAQIKLVKQHTFLEFIAGGTQINLVVGIDYTASNGDPRTPSSLHYQNPVAPNEYICAISAVGNVLLAYDSDGKVPAFGFGAKMPDGNVSHCFPLTFNPNMVEVFGVQGIIQAYANSLASVTLFGPTNFAPLIRQATEVAKTLHATNQDIQAYLILLIITDGEITDMDNTIHEIVEASYWPMSIIIVGVGAADFSKMEILDGDDSRLTSRSTGRPAKRDIVQFVPFQKYRGDPNRLAAEVLREVPGQFLEYMKSNNISPRPPPTLEQIQKYQQEQLMKNMAVLQTGQVVATTVVQAPPQQPQPSTPY